MKSSQLEAGDLTLDQAMTLFERGTALAARCNAQLNTAELRAQQLVPAEGEGYDLTSFEEFPPD